MSNKVYMRAEESGTRSRQLIKALECDSTEIPIGFVWDASLVKALGWVPFLSFLEAKYPAEVCRHMFRRQKAASRKEKKIADKLLKEEITEAGFSKDAFLAYWNARLGA